MNYLPCKRCGKWHDDGSPDYCLDCIDNGVYDEIPIIEDEFHNLFTEDLKQAFSEIYSYTYARRLNNDADV